MGIRQKLRDDKENKKFAIIILVTMITGGISMFFNMFITLGCYIVLFIYWGVHDYKHRVDPKKVREEELKILVEELEGAEIKKFIRDCFFNKGMSLKRTCKRLKEKYYIELVISRGIKAGEFKSEELCEKLYHILGFTTRAKYVEWEENHQTQL